MINRLIVFIICLLSVLHIKAQQSDYSLCKQAGLSVGIEKNSAIFLEYGFSHHWLVNVKHSIHGDFLKRQSYLMGIGYHLDLSYADVALNAHIGSDYDLGYVHTGFRLDGSSKYLWQRFKVACSIMPTYDSDLKYQTCWAFSLSAKVTDDISAIVDYARMPEYRIAYKRVYAGLDFKVKNLSVRPLVQIPYYDSGLRWDHSKIVISMKYQFKVE